MIFNSKLIICSIAFLTLAACSGGGGSNGAQPKYAANNAKLNEVTQDFNRVQRFAAPERSRHSEAAVSTRPGSVYEKSRRMEQAMANCDVRYQQPSPDSSNISFSMTIGGNCPIAAKYTSSMQMGNSSLSGRFSIDMKITNQTLGEMNDVYAANVAGSFQTNSNKLAGTSKGTISSKKYGVIDINGSVLGESSSRNSVHMENKIAFTIQGEVSEFVQITDANNSQVTMTYKINGQTVTDLEFFEAFKKLGFLGQGGSISDQSGIPSEESNETSPEEDSHPSDPKPGRP